MNHLDEGRQENWVKQPEQSRPLPERVFNWFLGLGEVNEARYRELFQLYGTRGTVHRLTRRVCRLLEVSIRSHLHVKVVAHPDIMNCQKHTSSVYILRFTKKVIFKKKTIQPQLSCLSTLLNIASLPKQTNRK